MKKLFLILAGILLCAGCVQKTDPAASTAESTVAPPVSVPVPDVKRGEYLVTIMACSDCHTPMKMGATGPEPDMTRFLTGHPEQMGALKPVKLQAPWMWSGAATNTAFSGPWGISYAINLTPDQNTGIGIWTEEMFLNSIKQGKHMGTSRTIMPPMPWPLYRQATDEDLRSIFVYLKSLPPVSNRVPEYQPPS